MGTICESWRTNKYIIKGDRMLRPGPAKWKRIHSCRMANIKAFQDHEHTISEESREEMDTEKPWWTYYNEIDYIMTDKPSMVTDVTVITRINIGSDHMIVMGSITLNTKAERRKLLRIHEQELTLKWFERRRTRFNSNWRTCSQH